MLSYLTDLFTWRLVLCALAQVFNTLVFGQVVLLLGHIFLVIQYFMQQFPVTREEKKNLNKHLLTFHTKNPELSGCFQTSFVLTHPLSTRNESLHTFPFLLSWNLQLGETGEY